MVNCKQRKHFHFFGSIDHIFSNLPDLRILDYQYRVVVEVKFHEAEKALRFFDFFESTVRIMGEFAEEFFQGLIVVFALMLFKQIL